MWYGQESVYKQKFQDPAAFFLTKEAFSCLGGERADAGEIIQDAIDRLVTEQGYGILYIPQGEYLLRRTLYIPPSVRLIGYGEKRPVLILPENTGNVQYMVWFIGDRDTRAYPPKDANAATFYSAVSNVDFRIEPGNPEAVCIRAHFAQHGFVSHCHFDLGDGFAGLYEVGNEMEDLTFTGGQYGIVSHMCSPGWPFVLMDSVFQGQKKAAVATQETGFTGFRLKISDTPRAFRLLSAQAWEKLYLEDCIFENISLAGISFYHTENIVQQVNLKNLFCSNVPVLLEKGEKQEPFCIADKDYLVEEYTFGYSLREGEEAGIAEHSVITPLSGKERQVHSDIPPVPDMKQWVSVRDYGACGDGKTDDTKALQEALSREKILYFPQGVYRVTDTLHLQKDQALIGMSPIATQIAILDDTPAFSGFGAPKPVLETAEGGSLYLQGIGVDTAGKNPRACGIKWMAGEHSYMNDVKFLGGHGNLFRDDRNPYAYLYNAGKTADYDPDRIWDFQYASLWITKGGGGIFKDIWSASPYAEAGIAITDTETPGKMYAISLEHHVRSEMKLYRTGNWSFYGLQTEEERAEGLQCLPLELVSCHDLLFANFFLFRVVAVDRSYDDGIRVWDCRDLTFLNLHNKAQMQYVFQWTLQDKNTGFYAKSPEYAKLVYEGSTGIQRSCDHSGEWEILAEGFDFAQGAVFDKEGNLYWCDKAERKIYQYHLKDDVVRPVYDIHFIPSALAVDESGDLLVAVDYSPLRTSRTGESYLQIDPENFHPFFSWFQGRGEKVYLIRIEDPFNTMEELQKCPVEGCRPRKVYRPAQMSYGPEFRQKAEQPVTGFYMAPDGSTALQATVDLARSLLLKPAEEGEDFYITDDQNRLIYCYKTGKNGNLTEGEVAGTRGQYGAQPDEAGIVWTVEDQLYGYRKGIQVQVREVPPDAYAILCDKDREYLLGRNHIYRKKMK